MAATFAHELVHTVTHDACAEMLWVGESRSGVAGSAMHITPFAPTVVRETFEMGSENLFHK